MPIHLFSDMGLIKFADAHAIQLRMVEKLSGTPAPPSVFLCLEHPPVLTIGRKGMTDHLLIPPSELQERGVDIHTIERGGDITYHGPGQLVLYPILRLKQADLSVSDFVWMLEEVMIRTVSEWGIHAARDPRNRGVWSNGQKIGFLGISVRRGITFHGLSLNVSPDLTAFSWINPCGLTGIQVTSMEMAGSERPDIQEVKTSLGKSIESTFNIELTDITLCDLKERFQLKTS